METENHSFGKNVSEFEYLTNPQIPDIRVLWRGFTTKRPFGDQTETTHGPFLGAFSPFCRPPDFPLL